MNNAVRDYLGTGVIPSESRRTAVQIIHRTQLGKVTPLGSPATSITMRPMSIRFFFQYRSRRWNRRLACRYGRPLKQRTVDRNIIFGHARGGKPLLEASPNRASIERNHSGEHPHRLVHSVTSPHFARFSCGMYVNFRQCAGVGSKIREFGVEGCRSHSSSSAHHTFSLWQETAKLLLYIDHRIPALQQAVVLPMSRYDIADVGVTQRERVMSAHVTNGKCHRPR